MNDILLKDLLTVRSIGQVNALQAALDFTEGMRKLQTMAGTGQEELFTISNALLDMAHNENPDLLNNT